MITPERREILRLLEPLSELAEDMRFGQLVSNLVTLAGGADAGAIWDIEDADLLPAVRKLVDVLTERRAAIVEEAAASR
jgi:hypothetical protein